MGVGSGVGGGGRGGGGLSPRGAGYSRNRRGKLNLKVLCLLLTCV